MLRPYFTRRAATHLDCTAHRPRRGGTRKPVKLVTRLRSDRASVCAQEGCGVWHSITRAWVAVGLSEVRPFGKLVSGFDVANAHASAASSADTKYPMRIFCLPSAMNAANRNVRDSQRTDTFLKPLLISLWTGWVHVHVHVHVHVGLQPPTQGCSY